MSGSMSRDDLVADLKASLHDAANVFTAAADADYDRLFSVAARDLGRYRPLLLPGAIALTPDVLAYAAPADLIYFGHETWSTGRLPQPWERAYPGPVPRVSVVGAPGARQLIFSPAPSALLLAVLGATFGFIYHAAHGIGTNAVDTTVSAADRGALILRAQAEAMREMAIRNTGKPITRIDSGFFGTPRNGTPSHLFTMLMDEFKGALA